MSGNNIQVIHQNNDTTTQYDPVVFEIGFEFNIQSYNIINTLLELILNKNRRQVTFFNDISTKVVKEDVISRHYNLMHFFNSLGEVNNSLRYVKIRAAQELEKFNIASVPYRWSSNSNLENITYGQYGLVYPNASGVFANRDHQLAIYTGGYIKQNTNEENES